MPPTRKGERIHYTLIKALKLCALSPSLSPTCQMKGSEQIIYEVLLSAYCLWFMEEAKAFSCFLAGMNSLSICFLLACISPLVFFVRHFP